jgi:hypothetical protein
LGRKGLEAILSEPSGTVRILTKNAAVEKDFDIISKYRNSVFIIGYLFSAFIVQPTSNFLAKLSC